MMFFPGKIYKISFRPETARISLKKNRQYKQEFISNDYTELGYNREYNVRNCYADSMYVYITSITTEGQEGELLITPVINFIYNGKNCCCWEDMGIFSQKNTFELME